MLGFFFYYLVKSQECREKHEDLLLIGGLQMKLVDLQCLVLRIAQQAFGSTEMEGVGGGAESGYVNIFGPELLLIRAASGNLHLL